MTRIALGIEYQGEAFYGWQIQKGRDTVQGVLQQALSSIAQHAVQLYCAGRTDRGVHALGQIAHFDTTATRPINAWVRGANTRLPKTVPIQFAQEVDGQFHARFSAKSRIYRYVIANQPNRPALLRNNVTWYPQPLNIDAMQKACSCLIGEHDFSSFQSAECQSSIPMRRILSLSVSKTHHYVIIDIEANAFLHHMVRNIAGTLLTIGLNEQPFTWMEKVLLAKDRRAAGETAPANGLYFVQPCYPAPYSFPHASGIMMPSKTMT